MLKTMRENVRHFHWILWLVIIAFIAIAFGSFGPSNFSDARGAATVGDQEVTFGELQRQYESLESRYRQMFGDQWSAEMAQQFGVARQALDQLISRKILLLEARRLGLTVTKAELQKAILDIPAFKGADGNFIGEDNYGSLLQSNGYTVESFEAALREDLLFGKIAQVLQQNLYLSDADLEEAYRQQVERAKIRYVQMPAARFSDEAKASQEEMEAYLATHLEELTLPAQRQVKYVLVDRNLMRDRVEIPQDELRAYYKDHASEFTTDEQVRASHILLRTGGERSVEEAKTELAAIRARIEAGEDFAQVARQTSEDPGSAQRGGDLDFFGRGAMVPQFEEAAFNAQVGDLVGPVESPFGVHLIKVTDRREAGERPFDEVKDQIRFKLAQDRVTDLARERAAQLASELQGVAGDARVEAMRAAAEGDAAVFFYEPPPFASGDPVAGIGRAPAFTEAAFGLGAGDLSTPVEVPRGFVVLEVEQALEPRAPQLSDVETQVRQRVEGEKRRELAKQRLAAAKAELDAGATLDQVADELQLSVQESDEFGVGGTVSGLGQAPGVVRAALGLDEGQVGGPLSTPQGAVLFQVSERTRFDPAGFAAAREQTRQQVLQQRGQLLQASLIEQRRQELGVTYSRQAIERFNLDGAGSAES